MPPAAADLVGVVPIDRRVARMVIDLEFAARRMLRAPRAFVLRRVEGGSPERQWLEHFSYSRAIYGFLRARSLNPHLIVDFDLDERSVVIDAGAYVGDYTAALIQRFGAAVYAFEPNPRPLSASDDGWRRAGTCRHSSLDSAHGTRSGR